MSDIKTGMLPDGLHGVAPRREPVFHAVSHDSSHWLATLDIIKLWGRQVLANNYAFDVYYAELYVGMPGEPKLMRCDLGITGTGKKPKLIVTIDEDTDGWLAGALWTCDL